MADTGAPWFIPYVEPGDLVRDYPAASLALGTAIAAGLSAAGPAGIGTNVVQTVKTDVFTASVTAGSLSSNVTGFSVTITPSSNTSKVLLLVSISMSTAAAAVFAHLFRDSTEIYRGDAVGSRKRAASGAFGGLINSDANMTSNIIYLDSPTSAAPTTYNIQLSQRSTGTAAVHVNRSEADANDAFETRLASSFTAIEVAA